MKNAESNSTDALTRAPQAPHGPVGTIGDSGFTASLAYRTEQVRVLFFSLPSLLFANMAVATIFVVMHWNLKPSQSLLVWWAILATLSGIRSLLYWHLRAKGHLTGPRFEMGALAASRWIWIYRSGVFASALVWGIGGYLFVMPTDPLLLAFSILTIGGMCAGSVNALSVDRVSSMTFLIVTPLPILYLLLSQGGNGAMGLSLFFVVGLLFVGLTTNRVGDGVLELIRLRYESMSQAQALREGEQRWKFALEGARQAVWDWNLATNMEFATERWQQMLGYQPKDTFQMGLQAWRENLHPDDLAHTDEAMRRAVAGESGGYDVDYRYRHKLGHWIWVHARGIVVSKDASGKPLRMVGTREDITETKALQAQLMQSQKMQTIGQLAGGVAHDFNNNLTAMMMSLDLLSLDQSMSAGAKETLAELGEMTDRAAAITSKLLLFASRKSVQIQAVDLNAALAKLSSMLRRLLGETVNLSVTAPESALFAKVDADLLDQALINLAVNARDAMPSGGQLNISLAFERLDQAALRQKTQGREGEFAVLKVHDTGTGMSAEVQKHLFEPFFTTKAVGRGTGLGLASVHGMTKQLQGWIEVESELGKGSCFSLYFPTCAAPEHDCTDINSKTAATATPLRVPRGVLVVEDELLVRESVLKMLKFLGIKAFPALHSADALHVWQQHASEIDLVLTDLVMPGELDGLALARRLRLMRAELPIIVMSGYSSDQTRLEALGDEGFLFMGKPFDIQTARAQFSEALIGKSRRRSSQQ